jgi:thiol:disulfide interchange protein
LSYPEKTFTEEDCFKNNKTRAPCPIYHLSEIKTRTNMKRLSFFLSLFLLPLFAVLAQQPAIQLYNPDADAKAEIVAAVSKAASEGKHVFLQIGGNWCGWCLLYHKFIHEDHEIDSLVRANYVIAHVNYSKENHNTDILTALGHPERFGFPVFVILDGNGNLLHIQDSALLEKDKGYDREKVIRFYKMWSAKALAL